LKIKIDTKGLRESRWYEYLVRFVFGGAVTALTGIVAKRYGPEIGGLFLAFPAIFPATATLIEKHEREKKEDAGLDGRQRGQTAVGADAAGAAMASIGLAAFGLVAWRLMPHFPATEALICATAAWLLMSLLVWTLRETLDREVRAWYRRAHPLAAQSLTNSEPSAHRRSND
jgi:uncharacterized membrane protein (GlpM family)